MAFRGETVEIPVGMEGLTGQTNLALLRPSQLTEARNISFWPGPIRRESGCREYSQSGIDAAVLSGWAWPADPVVGGFGVWHVVCLANGTIKGDEGDGDFTRTMATGLVPFTFTPVYAECGEESPGQPPRLAMALAPNPPRVITGAGATADLIPGAPVEFADGPPTVCVHEGRLWWGLRHRVWYSAPDDHLAYGAVDGGGNIPVYPGDGDQIVMLLSYKGLLLVFKYPSGIYAIDTSTVEVTGWRVTRITAGIGVISPRAGVILDNDVLFLDHGGNLQMLSGITEYGQIGARNLTLAYNLSEWMQRAFNPARYPQAVLVYSPARREIHLALTSAGGTTHDRRLIFDLNMPETLRARLCDRDRCEGLWLTRDAQGIVRPMCGGDDQKVWQLDEPGVLKVTAAGAVIGTTSAFATPPMDLGDPLHRKSGLFVEVLGDQAGDLAFDMDIEWDGRIVQTIAFAIQGGGDLFRDFRLGHTRLAGPREYRQRRRMIGSGHRLRLIVRVGESAADFSVSRLWVSGRRGDERPARGGQTTTQHAVQVSATARATPSRGRPARRSA